VRQVQSGRFQRLEYDRAGEQGVRQNLGTERQGGWEAGAAGEELRRAGGEGKSRFRNLNLHPGAGVAAIVHRVVHQHREAAS
jgi:hypothetical protein